MDLTIGTYIDGVLVDMRAADVIRGATCIKEGEEVLVTEVERVEANIIEVEVLENDVEVFGKRH